MNAAFIILLLILATLAVATVAAADQPHQWLLFHIDQNDQITLEQARPVATPDSALSPCVSEAAANSINQAKKRHRFVVAYEKPQQQQPSTSSEKCFIILRDPRVQYHDEAHPQHGESHFHGKHAVLPEQHFAVVVPAGVKSIEYVHQPTSKHKNVVPALSSSLHQRHHPITPSHFTRAAESQATAGIDPNKVLLTTLQLVGTTDNQRNMVFLSSGYTASEQKKFESDVTKLLDFLQRSSSAVSAMPYRRYFHMWNFFSVWHPSAESGASHPEPAGDGTESDDVLKCTYGASTSRILSCSRPRVLVLASYAPPDPSTSLTIILVNDNTFGGTGGSGICSVYNGDKMNVVFIHEIGHAFAELSDEYSYGTEEAEELDYLINCWYSHTRNLPWQPWINSGVLLSPVTPCTYENYVKPTDGLCLMHSEQPYLCEVCTEATVMTMYGLLTPELHGDTGFNIASPRFPSEHDTIVVRDNESARLWINSNLHNHSDVTGSFPIVWTTENGTVIAYNVSSIGISNLTGAGPVTAAPATWYFSEAAPRNYTVYAEIFDATNIFLPGALVNYSKNVSSKTSLRQRHPFRIWVIDPEDTTVQCTVRNDIHGGSYCAICQPGYERECTLNVSSRPVSGVADVSGSIPAVEGWLIGIGVGFLVIGGLAFYLAFKTMQQHAEETVGEILPLTEQLEMLRMAMMVFQILLLLASTFVIMYTAYMFMVVKIFGRPMVLGICITACCVWFVSFVSFSGAYFNNRKVVFASFALNVVFLLLTLLFTGMLFFTHDNLHDSEDIFIQLRDDWRAAVSSDPSIACDMEGYLYCSGFEESCVTSVGATSDCPRGCELANQIAFPCWLKVQTFVETHFYRAAIGGIVLGVFLFISMVMSVVFGCGMKINRSRVVRQRYKRTAENTDAILTANELKLLRKEFDKVDKDKKGRISREDFAHFYTKTMGVKLDKKQLVDYFDSLDEDGAGSLTFEQFVQIYMPQEDPGPDVHQMENNLAQAKRVFAGQMTPMNQSLGGFSFTSPALLGFPSAKMGSPSRRASHVGSGFLPDMASNTNSGTPSEAVTPVGDAFLAPSGQRSRGSIMHQHGGKLGAKRMSSRMNDSLNDDAALSRSLNMDPSAAAASAEVVGDVNDLVIPIPLGKQHRSSSRRAARRVSIVNDDDDDVEEMQQPPMQREQTLANDDPDAPVKLMSLSAAAASSGSCITPPLASTQRPAGVVVIEHDHDEELAAHEATPAVAAILAPMSASVNNTPQAAAIDAGLVSSDNNAPQKNSSEQTAQPAAGVAGQQGEQHDHDEEQQRNEAPDTSGAGEMLLEEDLEMPPRDE